MFVTKSRVTLSFTTGLPWQLNLSQLSSRNQHHLVTFYFKNTLQIMSQIIRHLVSPLTIVIFFADQQYLSSQPIFKTLLSFSSSWTNAHFLLLNIAQSSHSCCRLAIHIVTFIQTIYTDFQDKHNRKDYHKPENSLYLSMQTWTISKRVSKKTQILRLNLFIAGIVFCCCISSTYSNLCLA